MKTEGQKQSQKHEKRLAKEMDGTTVAASGAFWSRKGDVRTAAELIEHKWTGKLQFTLKSAVLKKITREAILDGRMPVLGIHLDGVDYVILLETDYLDIRQERECPPNTSTGETAPSVLESLRTSSTPRASGTSPTQTTPRPSAVGRMDDPSAQSDGPVSGKRSTQTKSTASGEVSRTESAMLQFASGARSTATRSASTTT